MNANLPVFSVISSAEVLEKKGTRARPQFVYKWAPLGGLKVR
jgi:hypothetical protein